MSSEFTGKVALVTGAASGIGAAVALQLAAGGASVVVADMDMDGAQEAERAITQAGGRAAAFRLDVA